MISRLAPFSLIFWIALGPLAAYAVLGRRRSLRACAVAGGLLIGLGCATFAPALSLILGIDTIAPLSLLLMIAALALTARQLAVTPALETPPPPRSENPWPARVLWALFIVAAITLLGGAGLRLSRNPDGEWDAWALWTLRARTIFRGAGTHAFSSGAVHSDYPILLPTLLVQGFLLAGSETPAVPAIFSIAFSALAASSLFFFTTRLRGRNAGLLITLILMTTPSWILQASWEYADVPLAAFAISAAGLLALSLEEELPAAMFLSGLCASLAAWTKNEGPLTAATLMLGILFFSRLPLRRRLHALARFSLGAAPFFALLLLFKHQLAPPNPLTEHAGDNLRHVFALDRWRWLLDFLVELASRAYAWGWMFFLVPLLALFAAFRPAARSAATRVLGLATFLNLALVIAIELTAAPDSQVQYTFFVNVTIERLLIQQFPALLFWIALALLPLAAVADSHPVRATPLPQSPS